MPDGIGGFLTGVGQGIIAPIAQQQQEEEAAQLAYQQFVQQQAFAEGQKRQQEQNMIQGLTPALTQYAELLQNSGREQDAQNILAGLNALQSGGIQGFNIQQKLAPKEEKKPKEKQLGIEYERISEYLFNDSYQNLNKSDQALVNKRVEEERIQKKLQDPTLALRLLDSYDREPNVRSFRELKDSYNQMGQVMIGGVKRGDFAFADQAAIVMFNKIIDPTSVVREGEFARTGEFIKFTERLKALVQKVQKGGSLTNKERQELLDTAHDLVISAHKVSKKRTETYIERGKRFNLIAEDFDPVGEISIPEKVNIPQDKIITPEEALSGRNKKK